MSNGRAARTRLRCCSKDQSISWYTAGPMVEFMVSCVLRGSIAVRETRAFQQWMLIFAILQEDWPSGASALCSQRYPNEFMWGSQRYWLLGRHQRRCTAQRGTLTCSDRNSEGGLLYCRVPGCQSRVHRQIITSALRCQPGAVEA